MFNCDKICVDCVVNDPVDVRIGGPEYLGFDFFVKEEDSEKMKEFIRNCLTLYGIPLIDIYNERKYRLNESQIWDEKRIENSIKNEAEYLIRESQRGYVRK